jgi:glycerophosphoryl diester phosphodiesterase
VKQPLVIGHRGASGYFPEHTLPSYALAILQGADYIEPDLVATRDGVLVARHENEIGGTTDVATHPEFDSRRRTQVIDGIAMSGWFTEDFTFAELKTLRARERIPELRPANAAHDGQFAIPAFGEILEFLAAVNTTRRVAGLAPVGVYPETKHPTHFSRAGLPLEPLLLAGLRSGLGEAPVFIQSFEVGNLKLLHEQCDWPLVQLMAAEGGPADGQEQSCSYAGMTSPEGLQAVARYAQVIGVQKSMVCAETPRGGLVATGLVQRAHASNLHVHAWTFRAENQFLPAQFKAGSDPAAHGNVAAEIALFRDAGIDGLFCDQPDLARAAFDTPPGT